MFIKMFNILHVNYTQDSYLLREYDIPDVSESNLRYFKRFFLMCVCMWWWGWGVFGGVAYSRKRCFVLMTLENQVEHSGFTCHDFLKSKY